jgi:hypothetical protein
VSSSGSRDSAGLLFGRAAGGAVERDVVRAELVMGLGRVPERTRARRRLLGEGVGVVRVVAVEPGDEAVDDRHREAEREQDQ